MILFIRQASIACRALQKVSKPVEIHLLQPHYSVISTHNRHLDFCTASNVHKNILAVMLCSGPALADAGPNARPGRGAKCKT